MADRSAIEWTDATWSPIRARNRATGKIGWHCVHASPGCANCYAESLNKRLGTGLPFKPGHEKDIEIFLDEAMLLAPLGWKKPRMIFVCSMTDLFADFVKDVWIDRVFAVMALSGRHVFQVLTKRPARMRAYCSTLPDMREPDRITELAFMIGSQVRGFLGSGGLAERPLPNVWLGVSAEDQPRADERIPDLLATPAAVRWVSYEPALGPVDFTRLRGSYQSGPDVDDRHVDMVIDALTGKTAAAWRGRESVPRDKCLPRLDWIVCGGESGAGARPMHPDWARQARDQCAAAGVAFFFKQWGRWLPFDQPPDPIAFAKKKTSIAVFGDGRDAYRDRAYDVGRRAAGRLLDGVEHNAMPEARR